MNQPFRPFLWLMPTLVAQLACSLTGVTPTSTPTLAAPPELPSATPTAASAPTDAPPATATPTAEASPTVASPTAAPVGPSCQVAYVRAGQLYCRLDGGGEVRLTLVDGGSLQGAAISSDGAWVAYLVGVPDGPADLFAIRVADAATGALAPTPLANATNLPGTQPGDMVSARNLAFVPGTQTLVFDTRYVPADGIQGPGEYINNDLWRVNVDGSGLGQLAPSGTAGVFAVSPTGGHVALSSPNTISVVADWISPNDAGGYYGAPPPADGRKVVVSDTDHLCYFCGDAAFVWRAVTRGYNPAFMDPYDCQNDVESTCNPNDPPPAGATDWVLVGPR